MKRPYIGITDFATAEQTKKMLRVFAINRAPVSKRRLMVGVMVSHKTLNHLPTKWAAVWPPIYAVVNIFLRHPLVMNTVHYADYDGIDVLKNLYWATIFVDFKIDVLQLDMIWPKPADIIAFRSNCPYVQVIIQANSRALDAVDNEPQKLVAKLKEYGQAIAELIPAFSRYSALVVAVPSKRFHSRFLTILRKCRA